MAWSLFGNEELDLDSIDSKVGYRFNEILKQYPLTRNSRIDLDLGLIEEIGHLAH